MRPLRLEAEGFTCFCRRLEIDFRETDLFVITGPTGSGKTSLIDAIVFSLYGCTPRCGERAISDLISLGSNRLATLLEFASGNSIYRISRTVRRTRTGVSSQRRLEKQVGQEWVSLADKDKATKARIQQIVGLDFEGFTRSVVLPQGEFDRFLKGDPKIRRDILTALLRLENYERMRSLASGIRSDCGIRASTLETVLKERYDDATPELEKDLSKALKSLTKQQSSETVALARLKKLEPLALDLRNRRLEKIELESRLHRIEKRFRTSEKKKAAAQAKLQETEDQLIALDRELARIGYDESLHLGLLEVIPKVKRLSELEEELEHLEETRDRENRRLTGLAAAREAADKEFRELRRDRRELESEVDGLEKKYREACSSHGTPEVIEGLAQRLRSAASLRDQRISLVQELEQLAALESQSDRALDSTKERLVQAEQELEKAGKELDRLRRLHAALEIRRHLKEGDGCPVCEQLVRRLPGKAKHPGLEDAERLKRRASEKHEKTRHQLADVESERRELPKRREVLAPSLQAIEGELSRLDQEIERVLGSSPISDAEKELEQVGVSLRRMETTVRDGREQLQTLRVRVEASRAALSDIERETGLADFSLKASEARVTENRSKVKDLSEDLAVWKNLEEIPGLLARQEQALQQRKALDKRKEALGQQFSAARELVSEAGHELHLELAEKQRVQQALDACNQDLSSKEDTLSKQAPELGRTLMEDEATQIEGSRRQLESRLDQLTRDIARAEEKLEQLARRIREAAQMRAQLKDLQEKAGTAGRLHYLLRGDQLVAFILGEVFSRLAVDGTLHLRKLTSDRYSFDTEASHFFVLDHWNGDERRPVATLSGGESFLASLALALALSESLDLFPAGPDPIRLDSLFLDEGFSTLDGETLDLVVQGIETLAAEQRLIGLVSHVPELAERFPYRIEVEKSLGGSRVKVC